MSIAVDRWIAVDLWRKKEPEMMGCTVLWTSEMEYLGVEGKVQTREGWGGRCEMTRDTGTYHEVMGSISG